MLQDMLFAFSGSTHINYTAYLLETIMNLGLESTLAFAWHFLGSSSPCWQYCASPLALFYHEHGTTHSSDGLSVYYRCFTQVGEDTSKLSFDDNEPALGRVDSILVPLPHTYGAIKRYIAKVEGKPIYAYSELYENTLAEQAIDDNKYVFLGHEDTAGWTADKPMALVQLERRPGLLNRRVKVLSNARAKDFNFVRF